ncbi:MAG TPA: hypothetical protein VJU80_04480 [Solirubrobacteraceae bacterium]|nr:hypothetical protein [Solirubrobacteraceae bacterium]
MTKRIFLALLFAPIVAGCGANKPTGSTGGSSAKNPAASAYAYSRCMRSHGVSNFPDPKVSVSAGHSSVGIAVNPSITGSPKFGSAQKACQGILGGPAMSQSQMRAQQQAHARILLAFARCLRMNHVGDFPDPNAQGQLPLPTVIAAGVDIHSRQFLDAARACVGVTHGEITMAQIEAEINGQP